MDLQKRLNAKIIVGKNQHLVSVESQIQEYFEGTRSDFEVSLDLVGTDFQKKVWKQLMKIPFGQVTTYLEHARALDKPTAARPVAQANGHNKIAIIVPCHRVIGTNGKLTGYGGGLPRKKWLLSHESGQIQ